MCVESRLVMRENRVCGLRVSLATKLRLRPGHNTSGLTRRKHFEPSVRGRKEQRALLIFRGKGSPVIPGKALKTSLRRIASSAIHSHDKNTHLRKLDTVQATALRYITSAFHTISLLVLESLFIHSFTT